jgi:predicted phage-related endonuclease
MQLYGAEMVLLEIQDRYKEAEENAKKIRETLCSIMEEQKIHSWTTPDGLITVTHTPASESFRVDSTKLRREYPLVYEKVVKPTKRKSYVTITNRAGEV